MKRLISITAVLVTLAVPFFILMTAIRLMFTPAFLKIEYNRPSFPPDEYGFTTADRLNYGGISMEYLLNKSGIEFLADVKLADGTPLYNERELSHMLDVKILIQNMVIAWSLLLIALALIYFWAWRADWVKKFWRSASLGGWITIGLIASILLGVALSFDWLFTNFHRIFFTGGTWLFYYSDSLIRLFPINFWQDAFIGMGAISLLLGILVGWLGNRLANRISI
jgi:integral membrane protein (TIGR01906 family)